MITPKHKSRAQAKTETPMLNIVRGLALGVGLTAMAALIPHVVKADSHENIIVSHSYSFFGDAKYPVDFPYLDYVNLDAPKGGEISVWAPGTFDSFSPYARKGRPGALSSIPYEPLMASTADDYGVSYGLLAEKLEYPESKEWVIFHLRPEARFSDGTQVTAQDVVFSHDLFLEQGLPSYSEAVSKRVKSAEALDDLRVKFEFFDDIPRRGLIGQVAGTVVFSEKWFVETGARLDEQRLEIAVGSGPYMLDSYDLNRQIIYKRNPDYWGKDLPLKIGTENFDTIRVEYFADSAAAFEGFKSGAYTFRQENSSRSWSTQYDFPAVAEGTVVREALNNGNVPRATGFIFNLDKPQFQDVRVREAIGLGYNFNWSNDTLQYGLFAQRESFWQNSDHAATGVPEGAELELLKSLGDLVDPAILTESVTMPHVAGARQLDRKSLRRAGNLLDEAGWITGDDGLRRKDGKTLELEFLERSPAFDRLILPFIENLKAMGIEASYNRVDPAQFTNRRRDRDFDMRFGQYAMPLLPSTGLRQQFGSDTADVSVFNGPGYSSPAVDAIIDHIVAATDTETVKVGARAMDRIMRAERFMVPVWYLNKYWVARYDIYGRPDVLPPYSLGHLDFWWYDQDRANALRAAGNL
ncbi:MAG: extracellular solute-binding protein [Planktomarina sp.]